MDAILGVVALQQRLITLHADIRRDVIRLGLAYEGVKQQAVYDFQRSLLDVLMGAVDGVAGLGTRRWSANGAPRTRHGSAPGPLG